MRSSSILQGNSPSSSAEARFFVFRHDPPRGFWWDEGVVDRDVLALIEVDVPDTPEARVWLRAYARDVLRRRFQQKAIYLKFVGPVEHLIVREEGVNDED
jgi:hypothetical protein